jgi:hypothetical protein
MAKKKPKHRKKPKDDVGKTLDKKRGRKKGTKSKEQPRPSKIATDIFEVELADGDLALAIELPMEPYGVRMLCTNDDSEGSEKLLHEIRAIWTRLWPKMQRRYQDTAGELDLDEPVDTDSLIARTSRLTKGIFMADRCDIYVSLVSDDHPDWDYFIKDGKIVHFQPVF